MLQKINLVREQKCVVLLVELLEDNGRNLTNWGIAIEERSSVLQKGEKIENNKPTKGIIKVWEQFSQWLQ